MKAKEYFDAYSSRILPQNEDSEKAIVSMFNDMDKEFKALIKSRNIQKIPALQSLVREVNTKWNAVVALFEKKGCYMVKKDGFTSIIDLRIQEATAEVERRNKEKSHEVSDAPKEEVVS